jgi:hypothetical protein
VIRGAGNISLRPPFLVDSAWETAQVTHAAVHLDPESSRRWPRRVARHGDFTTSRMVDMLYGSTVATGALSALSDLTVFEQTLLDAYDDPLSRLCTRCTRAALNRLRGRGAGRCIIAPRALARQLRPVPYAWRS